jgi:hypothetical protein
MNIIFLDYDGVVNNIIWDPEKGRADYSHPFMGKVNNFQACQWLSEFCEKYDYKIVVTSTWRLHPNYKECLIAGGLRDGIEILGRVGRLSAGRGAEIMEYLSQHPEVEKWLVLDDEDCSEGHPEIENHQVLCLTNAGFGLEQFEDACALHQRWCDIE